ncbi:hypothetical protein QAD02_020550 [Eretmocerus hayati]|uniref:Uncharacterized protein n=1 Tax=Eretmocerus hayati TaxID=131215 RepID=A0ACC2PMX4_9HYME|nr:hypothetical protein QAD02_020550 [Eretmocerus hayati]
MMCDLEDSEDSMIQGYKPADIFERMEGPAEMYLTSQEVLDGLKAMDAANQDPKYSDDGKDYVFTIRSNTRLNVLGIKKHTIDDAEEEQVELYSNLQDCLNVTKTIDLHAYIKSNGFQAEIPESRKRIGLLTDLKFKINIAIFNFEDQRVFEQGQKIKVRGKMNNSAMNPTINVENSKDIEVIEGVEKESADKLRKINKFPKNDQFKDEVSKQPKLIGSTI